MAEKKTDAKCMCNPWMGIVALILGVAGLYSIILGIKIQFIVPAIFTNWYAMLAYLVGFILMALAKMSKWKAFGCCNKRAVK